MDTRIEEAEMLLMRYRSQFTAEPFCSVPQAREYVDKINEVMMGLNRAGNELAQFLLKQEIGK